MKTRKLTSYVMTSCAILLSLGASRNCGAANITLTALSRDYFRESTGAWLQDGSLVEIGEFSVSDVTLQNLVSGGQISHANYLTLLNDFIPLDGNYFTTSGTGATSGPVDANAGALNFTFTGSNVGFAGGNIYALVFNTGSTGTATQVGVFTGDATWKYPVNMTAGSVNISADQASETPIIGSFSGSFDSNPYNNGPNGPGYSEVNALQLAPIVVIPEPSTAVLAGIGLAGVFVTRRRNKRV